jgi:hypothetical protein
MAFYRWYEPGNFRNIFLKITVIRVPVFSPHLSGYSVVKALARFDAKPGTRNKRNQYIFFSFYGRNKM